MRHVLIHSFVWDFGNFKYNGGNIPQGSRFDNHKDFFKDTIGSLTQEEGKRKFVKIDQLTEFAQKGESSPTFFLPLPLLIVFVRTRLQTEPSGARVGGEAA